VQSLVDRARYKHKRFAIVQLDAAELLTEPTFALAIDGIAQRSLWYIATIGGTDYRQSSGFRNALLPALRTAAAAGIPVFTIDFAADQKDADTVYAEARKDRFIAYVTPRIDVGLTKTPPPGL
jgi:endo-alpha-1,4-polygalactosaminidase (GH114 family)